jgi:1,4-dihydroxy-2-naphthoate polyprenyltransferase
MPAWWLAARPKTLPAAVVPVWVGSVLAWHHTSGSHVSWTLALCALGAAMALQIACNFFNDVLDFKKGADTAARLGPVRATAAGLLQPRTVLALAIGTLAVAVGLAVPLFLARGWPILAIGVPSLYFSFGYTGGPLPLAYRGLGDFFVLLFFGLVAVTGTVFVHTGEWWPQSVLLGLQVGLLATALIAINNLRDVEEDTATAKRTLAVRFGPKFAKKEITVLCLLPYLLGALWSSWPAAWALPLLGLPLSLILVRRIWRTAPGRIYNQYLAMAAAQMILFALLFTFAGLVG